MRPCGIPDRWVDEQAVTTEGTEIRPASQNGPLIVCVDTSGSMQGTREKVAKAVAVESLRQVISSFFLFFFFNNNARRG